MAQFLIRSTLLLTVVLFLFGGAASAQSRDQNFPTAITSNDLVGSIKARPLGDSRITSYFFEFEGTQGDIFINLVTKNFTGDIDVFIKDGLRPLTKIVVFDPSLNETGRLIYLRKEEKLLLRIQGRTPNDEAAEYRVRFGGSFVALKPRKEEAEPTIEAVNEPATGNTRKKTVVQAKEPESVKRETASTSRDPRSLPEKSSKVADKPEVVVKSTIPPPTIIAKPASDRDREVAPSERTKPQPTEKKLDPLANRRLVIQLKDGSVIERPMTEVTRFNVDKGWLTVMFKGSAVSKYSLLDVVKVTIE